MRWIFKLKIGIPSAMNLVEPIRSLSKIAEFSDALKEQPRNYLMFILGIHTGLRISDILNLKVSDVRDKERIRLKEKKTGKEKTFPIPEAVKPLIQEYVKGKDNEDYLFKSREGKNKPITRFQAYILLNNRGKAVGLSGIGTHTLRKTFGYHHYKKFKDVALLMNIFNHSSPSVTMKYIGISQDEMDRSMASFSLFIDETI